MPIQSISRVVFNELHPNRRPAPEWMQKEVEWFAERSRVLIGYIARHVQSDDWTFVVEGRDEHGEFHPIESADHIDTPENARELLDACMRKLSASGMKVFPRRVGALRFG
jgi:hypothetical protein